VPGYELTQPWLTEEGLPKKGVWATRYYCGDGKQKKGCKAAIRLRKSMLALVFIDEADIFNETDVDYPDRRPALTGKVSYDISFFFVFLLLLLALCVVNSGAGLRSLLLFSGYPFRVSNLAAFWC
jgi:hypothetical protein